jgi:hypothetical protein
MVASGPFPNFQKWRFVNVLGVARLTVCQTGVCAARGETRCTQFIITGWRWSTLELDANAWARRSLNNDHAECGESCNKQVPSV